MNDYYQRVAQYFDQEADDFESRYRANPILQRIRQAFREEVKAHNFESILEVGFGTGIDVCHFARVFPERQVFGIDVSPRMRAIAEAKRQSLGLTNVRLEVGSAEDLGRLFPERTFDLAYVFFGALNTVEDLGAVARALHDAINPGGILVLTFVNRWYVMEMIRQMLKGDMVKALRRLRITWGGYSSERFLPSRCVSPKDVLLAFGDYFECCRKRGFSILYPPWYRPHTLRRIGSRGAYALWRLDEVMSRTALWSAGEYALYVFVRPL